MVVPLSNSTTTPESDLSELVSVSEAMAHDNRRVRLNRSEQVNIQFANSTQIFKTVSPPSSEPDETLVSAICGLVRYGHHAHIAAVALGISRKTFERWCELGFNDLTESTVYCRMVQAIEAAEALGEIEDIERINAGGEIGHIQWKTERRRSKRWGNRSAIAIANADTAVGDVVRSKPIPEYNIEEGAEIWAILEEVGITTVRDLPAIEAPMASPEPMPDINPIEERVPDAPVSLVERFLTGTPSKKPTQK
jgi:hypothetical protein